MTIHSNIFMSNTDRLIDNRMTNSDTSISLSGTPSIGSITEASEYEDQRLYSQEKRGQRDLEMTTTSTVDSMGSSSIVISPLMRM